MSFMFKASPKRGCALCKKGERQEIIDIFEKWDLDVATIGEVTDTGRMELFWHGERILISNRPNYPRGTSPNRPTKRPWNILEKIAKKNIDSFKI